MKTKTTTTTTTSTAHAWRIAQILRAQAAQRAAERKDGGR